MVGAVGVMSAFVNEICRSPVLFSSFCLFVAVYAFAYYGLFSGWKGVKRFEAASCCISLVHGTVIAILATYDAMRNGLILDAPNTELQNALMEYSMAYFITDLIHYLVVARNEYLFIFHHIATSSYMLSCRYGVKHGGSSVSILVAVGEATSPFQNVWTVCRMGRDSAWMKRVYEGLSPFFTVIFTVFRVGIAPAVVWKLSRFYIGGGADEVIPRWLAYCWMAKSFLAICGSMVWVYKLWSGLLRFYSSKKNKKAERDPAKNKIFKAQ